jgi:hypothetical protein
MEKQMLSNTFWHGHALLIGVGANLPITVRDAIAIHDVLVHPSHAAYQVEQIELLAEIGAVRKATFEALDRFIIFI